MSEGPPRLHVMIPAHEGRDALLDCLESVFASHGVEARALVIDDASTDGTADAVRQRFPQCRVLVNPENLGFARTCNRGFKELLAEGAPAVLLLNQDTRLAPDAAAALLRFLESHPSAEVVGPKTYSTRRADDGRERLLYAGSWRGRLPLKQRIPGIEQVEQQPATSPLRVDYVWGHGMLLRASVLERTGGFDTDYPMYFEDLDLCRRVQDSGGELWCEPAAVMWHDVVDGARAQGSEYWRWACKVRGTATFHAKHYGRTRAVWMTPATLAWDAYQLLRAGHARAAWHVTRAGLRHAAGLTDPLHPREVLP